jgi:hypothetical protein
LFNNPKWRFPLQPPFYHETTSTTKHGLYSQDKLAWQAHIDCYIIHIQYGRR